MSVENNTSDARSIHVCNIHFQTKTECGYGKTLS